MWETHCTADVMGIGAKAFTNLPISYLNPKGFYLALVFSTNMLFMVKDKLSILSTN
jgi:hypothetical protein